MPPVVAGLAAIGGVVGGGAVAGGFVVAGVAALGFVVADTLDPDIPGFNPEAQRNNNLMIRKSTVARRIGVGRSRVGGIWFYVETTGNSNQFLHLVLGLCEGPIEEIESIWLNDHQVDLITTGTDSDGIDIKEAAVGDPFEGKFRVKCHLGGQSQIADETLVSESTNWTSDHKLNGIAYLYCRLEYDKNVFNGRVPEISAIIKGTNTIKDPRLADASAYTTNPALCLAHYLTTAVKGPNADYDDEIDKIALSAAANVCDESVSLKIGGTENRYTLNGIINLDDDPESIINKIKDAFAGTMIYTGGKFVIDSGAYEAPTFTITEDMIVGSVTLKNKQPKRERVNIVKGTFIDETNGWQLMDLPSTRNPAYETEDGEELQLDSEYSLTKSAATGQRLNKIKLEKSRLDTTLQLKCNLKAFRAQAGKTIRVDIARYSYSGEIFKVLETSFGASPDGQITIDLTLRRTESSVYDWDHLADEELINTPPSIVAPGTKVSSIVPSEDGGPFGAADFPISLTLSTATEGSTIRYSKSVLPNSISEGTLYESAITVEADDTIYAKAFKAGFEDSNPLIENYQLVADPTPPVFNDQSFNYGENRSLGETIATLVATDNIAVTGYTFTASGTSTSADGLYQVDTAGNITLTTSGVTSDANDFESGSNSHVYNMTAFDAFGNTDTADITLNVTDLEEVAPTISDQSFNYAENRDIDEQVATVVASDNVGVTGFTFTATETQTSSDGFFDIDNSGNITLNETGYYSEANDYETGSNAYVHNVTVSDAAGNTSTADITLNVTDQTVEEQPPLFAAQTLRYVQGKSATDELGDIIAIDNTGSVFLTFTATGTTTSSDGYFKLNRYFHDRYWGEITASGASGDANSMTGSNSFVHNVTATDDDGNTTTADITFEVIASDTVAPTITASQVFNYPERSSAGFEIGTIEATDNVSINNTTLTFTSTGTQFSDGNNFRIEGKKILLNNVNGAANDHETSPNSFVENITATDDAGNSSTEDITLNVTDVSGVLPLFIQSVTNIDYLENQTTGALLGTVPINPDYDINQLYFTVTGTQTSSDGYYQIDNFGNVTITASGVSSDMNDFETGGNSVSHTITATDGEGNFTTNNPRIIFNVLDMGE